MNQYSVVAYGGGTNSTAMLIGLKEHGIIPNIILFADTGAEQPRTYEYIPIMNEWLIKHGMPQITVVKNVDKNGKRLTLEQECLRSHILPALAYGHKDCSLKHKAGPQDKFCNNYGFECISIFHLC
jgi:3'-phosphoadenosine 5'-phosphosulfate sulfotransferase (PAPS reductase)/FAD synthetase